MAKLSSKTIKAPCDAFVLLCAKSSRRVVQTFAFVPLPRVPLRHFTSQVAKSRSVGCFLEEVFMVYLSHKLFC